MNTLRTAAVALFFGLAALASSAAEKGSFGFSLAIESDGFSLNPMNPTLKSVFISKVVDGSSAQLAGLLKGDQIVEVEGRPVAGAKANDLKPHLSKSVGESVSLKVRKAAGDVVAVTLAAGKSAEPR